MIIPVLFGRRAVTMMNPVMVKKAMSRRTKKIPILMVRAGIMIAATVPIHAVRMSVAVWVFAGAIDNLLFWFWRG